MKQQLFIDKIIAREILDSRGNPTVEVDVILENGVSIWYGAVLRGDHGKITLGEGTNVQDNAVIHDETTVGKYCTIGHSAIVHGCTIGDGCLIGMGAIILGGAQLGDGCLVAAGSVVTGKTAAPAGWLLMGNPAKLVRNLSPEELMANLKNAPDYVALGNKTFGNK